ncbi:MAG: collagen-like protein [Phycisphaerae bacterium]|nr:collagen-like protein [Phycisphaerae bacterium]
MKTKGLLIAGIAAFVFLVSSSMASEADLRREQLRLEVQASFTEIEQSLQSILKKVNLNQRPDAMEIQQAAELLETNRRNAATYDSSQKAAYMLLQSWTLYYQDEPVQNLNWAMRANREDETNGDAWISQTLFSLIYGRRPLEPTPVRQPRSQTEPQRQFRGRQADAIVTTAPPVDAKATFGNPGTLVFDLTTLRRDFLRERFVRQEYKTVDNRKIVYVPDSDILCILFWQSEESRDPNTPDTPGASGVPGVPGVRGTPGVPGVRGVPGTRLPQPRAEATTDYSGGRGATDVVYHLASQRAYFDVMQDVLADKKEVKFVEMNVNSAGVAPEALEGDRPVAPLVIAAQPQSEAMQFAELDVKTPFMAIIDKGGQVKYSGPADGFMPAFILSHLTGVEIDLADFQAAPSSAYPVETGMPQAADPNQVAAGRQSQQSRELPEHQQMEAEKQLAFARDFFMEAPRMRIISYKRGVDMCRDIIRNYANTIYADQARQLLRQVPERHRATYNITDAELGL